MRIKPSKATEDIRFGIIGTGNIADACHAPALRDTPGVSLWSVLSRDHDRALSFAQKFGAKAPRSAHTDFDAFLADPALQGVIITSPDNLHATQIIACARAGKHVLVEKPMVVSHQQGIEVIEACEKNDVTLGVGFHLRWHDGHRVLHRLVTEEAALGDLRHINVSWPVKAKDPSNWRTNPDLGTWWSLASNGAHCLDLVRWFADDGKRSLVRSSSVIGREVYGGPHEESAAISFVYSDGLTAHVTTSVLYDAPSRFEVIGSRGAALCEHTLSRFGKGSVAVNGMPLVYEQKHPFYDQIADFAAAIREKRDPEVTGIHGLMIVDDMIAATHGKNRDEKTENSLQSIKLELLSRLDKQPLPMRRPHNH